MKQFATFLVPIAALAFLGGAACGGKKAPPPVADAGKAPEPETKPPEPDTAKAPEPDTAAQPDAAPAPAGDATAAPDAGPAPAGDVAAAGDATPTAPVDYVRAIVMHTKSEKGSVTADFKTFKVVEANVDLTKLETAKAVIEVDASSVATGKEDRDADVKSGEFLDVAKFPVFTITVDRVKAVAGSADTYDATATVDLHGVKKEVPVQFKVVEKKEGGAIVVEGKTTGLARADWGITADPQESQVAPTLDVEVRLTLSNVAPPPVPK